MNFTAFWIYDFIKTYFAEVTTLSQESIFARVAENNRDKIFSKLLADLVYDNLPKSPKKAFFKKCELRPFVSSQLILYRYKKLTSSRKSFLFSHIEQINYLSYHLNNISICARAFVVLAGLEPTTIEIPVRVSSQAPNLQGRR